MAVVGVIPSTIFNLIRRSKMLQPDPFVMAAIYFGIGAILGGGLVYWRERRTMQQLENVHRAQTRTALGRRDEVWLALVQSSLQGLEPNRRERH